MVVRDVFDSNVGSIAAASQMILEEVSDYADAVNRARVGYVYSSAQQQKSLLASIGAPDEIVDLSGTGNGSIAYIKVLWRPFTTGPPPAVDANNDADDEESDSEVEIIRTVRKRLSKI